MERVMERVHVDERGLFDPSQGREAPASEASDSPRFGAMCRCPRLSSLEEGETLMLRRILIASAALAMLLVTSFPDYAFARGGVRAGGYRGGAVAVRGPRGGAVAARGYRGGAVAVRGGRYGYRGYGVGAAAVGAAAVGAAATGAYYRSGCGYDAYGNWVCPNY
jgi:hypothetical protein